MGFHEEEAWELPRFRQRECFLDAVLDGRRFIAAHSDAIAKERKSRGASPREATSYLSFWVLRTHEQQESSICKDRLVLSHNHTLLGLHKYVTKVLGQIGNRTTRWAHHKENRSSESLICGKLILVTLKRHFPPKDAVFQYKELNEIEGCSQALKSSVYTRPVYDL